MIEINEITRMILGSTMQSFSESEELKVILERFKVSADKVVHFESLSNMIVQKDFIVDDLGFVLLFLKLGLKFSLAGLINDGFWMTLMVSKTSS